MSNFETFLTSESDAIGKGKPPIIRQALSLLDAAELEQNQRIDQGQRDENIYIVRDALNNYRNAIIEGDRGVAEAICSPIASYFPGYIHELGDLTAIQGLAYNYILAMGAFERVLKLAK